MLRNLAAGSKVERPVKEDEVSSRIARVRVPLQETGQWLRLQECFRKQPTSLQACSSSPLTDFFLSAQDWPNLFALQFENRCKKAVLGVSIWCFSDEIYRQDRV